jgi:hypothetical protein
MCEGIIEAEEREGSRSWHLGATAYAEVDATPKPAQWGAWRSSATQVVPRSLRTHLDDTREPGLL